MRASIFLVGLAGCAALPVSALVKAPVDQQCQQFALKGCPHLVDGIILYAEGNKPAALEKINEAKAANTPEDLKRFAKTLSSLGDIPPELAGPLVEVAALLTVEGSAGTTSPPTAPAKTSEPTKATESTTAPEEDAAKPRFPERDGLAVLALSAATDIGRMRTESVTIATFDQTWCRVAELDAICVKRTEGPLVITDLMSVQGCPERILVGATNSDSTEFGFQWVIELGSAPITSARLLVRGGEWLQVAVVPGKKGFSQSPQCIVTWSGYRPRIVPQN